MTEKPSSDSAVVSAAISWWFRSTKALMESSSDRSLAWAGRIEISAAVPRAVRPLRASDVHDSRVQRIAAITPDMVCPKPHDFTPRRSPAVRESSDNIPKGSSRVRVQIVNVNCGAKIWGIKLDRHDFYENESAHLADR